MNVRDECFKRYKGYLELAEDVHADTLAALYWTQLASLYYQMYKDATPHVVIENMNVRTVE